MRNRSGADVVAIILALALGLISVLILLATTIQILDHESPDLTLSENATQILIAAIGGLTGLLGGYIGFNTKHGRTPPDE
jgi:hypothetical protein